MRRAFTLIELLVVVAIVAVLIALLVPAVQKVREAGSRTECQNNLKQLGLALHNFHDAHQVFPASGWTTVGPGNPLGKYVGWRPLTLPYIEQENLKKLYDFSLNWWDGTNPTAGAVPVKVYQCPSVPGRTDVTSAAAQPPRPAMTFTNPIAPTDYEAIMGVQPASINPHVAGSPYSTSNRFSVMYRNSRTKMRDVLDGTSNTIMVVECSGRPLVYRLRVPNPALANGQGIGWIDSEGPFSLDGASADGTSEGCGAACSFPMNRKNDNEPFSFHSGGANFLYADGHVVFLDESTSIVSLAAQCTAKGDEP